MIQRLHETRVAILAVGLLLFAAGLVALSPAWAAEARAATQQRKLPKMIDIGAKKCIPCKMMIPIMEDLEANYTESLVVEFIDVWENPGAGRPYAIRSIPTQIFYDASGKELTRHIGYISKEAIIKTFKDFGIEIKRNTPKGG